MLVHVKPFVMENQGYINANYEWQAFYVTIFCEANHTSDFNLHYGEKQVTIIKLKLFIPIRFFDSRHLEACNDSVVLVHFFTRQSSCRYIQWQ